MFYNHGYRIFDQSWLIFGIWMNLKDAYSIMMMSRPLVSMPWWFSLLSFSLQIVLFSVILTGMLEQIMILQSFCFGDPAIKIWQCYCSEHWFFLLLYVCIYIRSNSLLWRFILLWCSCDSHKSHFGWAVLCYPCIIHNPGRHYWLYKTMHDILNKWWEA